MAAIRIRRVAENDLALLYEWVNDPDVRAMAFHSGTIGWEEHVAWFRDKMKDPNAFMYLALLDDEPIGQIRFDVKSDGVAVVDVHIRSGMRGRGLAAMVIIEGVARLFRDSQVDSVRAAVKLENERSFHSFIKAGFEDAGTTRVHGVICHSLAFRRH